MKSRVHTNGLYTFKVTKIGPNQHEVLDLNGSLLVVLVSYNTPVAYRDANGRVNVTEERFSRATTKHVKSWAEGHETGGTRCQATIEEVLFCITGSKRLYDIKVSEATHEVELAHY